MSTSEEVLLAEAVDAFSAKMKGKLIRKKRDGYSGWRTASPYLLADLLWKHLKKGDLVDVANFCMMLDRQNHGAKLTLTFEPVKAP